MKCGAAESLEKMGDFCALLAGLPAGLDAGRSKAGCALASNCDCHTFVFQFVLFEMRACMTTVSSL